MRIFNASLVSRLNGSPPDGAAGGNRLRAWISPGRRVLHALMRERAALMVAVRLTLIAAALAAAYLAHAGGRRRPRFP